MLALVVYYCAQRGVFQGKASGDGWFGFQYLRAIVWFQTLDMKQPLPEFQPFFGSLGPGHHMPNRCPFGPVLVWMPFYLVACAIQGLFELLKLAPPGRGQSPFEAWVTALGTLAGVLVGWRYSYVLVERWCGRMAARIGSIAAVWATPIAWYAVTQPFYQHGLAFCFVAILIERWDATRGDFSRRRMITLGVIGGLAMMMRPQEALWLLLPGGELVWHFVRGPNRLKLTQSTIWLTASTILTFLPQMAVWYYYTGNPLTPAQAEPLRPLTPFFAVTLFSTRGGLFPWSPVTYAAVCGLWFCRKARVTTLAMLAVFVLEIYVVSSAWVITGGYGYGARRLSDGAVLIALGIGLLWARVEAVRWQRWLVAGFVGFCVVMNIVTMELLRWKVIPSSGAYARSAERFLADTHAPAPIARLFGVVGYPFVQPAGWLFALWHRVPASQFENVVGNWFLDRDGQWFQIQSKALLFDKNARSFVVDGIAVGERPPATVTGPARLLLPMFAREPIVVHVVGLVPAGARAAVWNGVTVPATDEASGVRLTIPVEAMRAGTNELTLTLPVGSNITKLEFDATTQWWRKP
jgi:hypothetical protein